MRLFYAPAATLILVSVSQCMASHGDDKDKETQTSLIRIIAQPKTSRPFNWKCGQKVTVGVRFVSDEGTTVVGVATDVELVATKSHTNRVDMMLRAPAEKINRIRDAALQSEYWFEIMPFHKRHLK